jgi:hypothetical protein
MTLYFVGGKERQKSRIMRGCVRKQRCKRIGLHFLALQSYCVRVPSMALSLTAHRPSTDGLFEWPPYQTYNFQDLRPELKVLGINFCGHSDTEACFSKSSMLTVQFSICHR